MSELFNANKRHYQSQLLNSMSQCDKVIVWKGGNIVPSRIYLQFEKNKGLVTQNYLFDALA